MTTGKQKAARVPVDYLARAARLKWWLTGGLAAVTALALAGLALSGRWKAAASPGPLHAVHAAWENDCAACHAPLSPAGGDNPLGGAGRPSDALCKGCHAGPPHHPGREIAEEVGSCGSCHHEHRGRNASLTDLRDDACTACHARLPAHVAGGTTRFAEKITAFHVDHPGIRPVADPGHLKFNHKVHLAEGLKHAATDARAWTLNDVSDEERERYRRQQREDRRDGSAPVQLTCASCHETDGGTTPTAGAYLPPVSYARHCQGCHPLTLGAALPKVKVPHGLQTEDVRNVLWGAFVEQASRDHGRRDPPPLSPLPGRSLDPEEEKARAEIEGRVSDAERFLRRQDADKLARLVFEGKTACGLCHEYRQPKEDTGLPQVVPVKVPEVWLKHARFDHRSHRAVDCQECHARAADSTTNADVLLPDVEVCRRCHAPRATSGGQPVGGVRHECTTCHDYHDGDGAVRGRAGAARGVLRPGSIDELLSGRMR
jgi:hypothetical protein